jgi:hypothetical protein
MHKENPMSTRILRSASVSWLTLAVFVPFAVTTGIPARARAATHPIVSLTITQSGKSATFYGAEGEDGKLVLIAKDSAGFRIVIDESDLESVKAKEIKDDVYVLAHEDEESPQSTLEVTLGGASGPEEGQITYSGTAEDGARRLDYKAVVNDVGTRALPAAAVVVIVVVAVGAVLCLGVIGIEAATQDCAKECTTRCAGGQGVAECKTDIIAGVDYSKDKGVRVGCSAKCEGKCSSMPLSLAPSPLVPDGVTSLAPAPSCS